VGDEVKAELPGLEIVEHAYEAASGAHCAVLCTEWDEFAEIDFDKLRPRETMGDALITG
jgi:hypothetical protein